MIAITTPLNLYISVCNTHTAILSTTALVIPLRFKVCYYIRRVIFILLLSLGESVETGTDNRIQDEPANALTISRILGVSIPDPPQYSSIRQVLETWEEIIRKKPIRKCDRRELSNNLLRAGFKQFALEIMTGRKYLVIAKGRS